MDETQAHRLTTLEMARFARAQAFWIPRHRSGGGRRGLCEEVRARTLPNVPAGTPVRRPMRAFGPARLRHPPQSRGHHRKPGRSRPGWTITSPMWRLTLDQGPAGRRRPGRQPALAPGFDHRHPCGLRHPADVVSASGRRRHGRTRYLPGSHLRIVSEAAIGRYQEHRRPASRGLSGRDGAGLAPWRVARRRRQPRRAQPTHVQTQAQPHREADAAVEHRRSARRHEPSAADLL